MPGIEGGVTVDGMIDFTDLADAVRLFGTGHHEGSD
jgi:hypothetical protein